MKLLVQKSLKTKLRLKRYMVLKLHGLKCKISELGTDFLLNRGLNHNLIQAQGVLCKTTGLIRILIYFYKGKTVDRVHELWTAQGWPVHGGLTTGTGQHACRSAAHRRCKAQELTAGWRKRRGAPGVLTEGFYGRFNGEVRPAAVKGERRR
jgi:hypothetical protein